MGELAHRRHAAAREVFKDSSERLGIDLRKVCFERGELNYLQGESRIIQPSIVAVDLAEYAAWRDINGEADVVTGLSLGMFAAMAAAGVFESYDDAVEAAARRAKIMHATATRTEGKMAGAVGMVMDKLEPIVHKAGAEFAVIRDRVRNSFVITGTAEEVGRVEEEAKKEGLPRWEYLNISGMFHSKHQKDSVKPYDNELNDFELHDPLLHLLGNNAMYLVSAESARQHLLDQIEQTSDWDKVTERLALDGITKVVELGPDKKRGLARQMVKNHKASEIEFPFAA
ncbi:acyltransferase domain-containing protein [Candidatus Saccharibacteria bacterium]|nr:acyltransferase domain-containing protein [Candidatus Saccharibacteria bacterium]